MWRDKLDTICDMLIALRKRLRIAKHAGAYSTYGEEEILKILSSICEEIGVRGLHFHREQYRR